MYELTKKIRQALGWSQTELAEAIGITQGQISLIENGKRYPSSSTNKQIMHIAKSNGISISIDDIYSCNSEYTNTYSDKKLTAP